MRSRQQLVEEALANCEKISDEWQLAMSQNSLADIVRCRGAYADAATLASSSLTIFRKLGDRSNTAWALYTQGHAARQAGDCPQAIECWTESLSIGMDLGKHQDVVLCLAALAGVYYATGQLSRSATLFGVADALMDKIGVRWSPYDEDNYRRDRAETQVRADGRAIHAELGDRTNHARRRSSSFCPECNIGVTPEFVLNDVKFRGICIVQPHNS